MKLFRGLLVSCHRNMERRCMAEMKYTLSEKLGVSRAVVRTHTTGISGLVTVQIKDEELDVKELVRRLGELEREEAYFVSVLKIKPIEKVIQADYELMKETIPELVEPMEGPYRISVSKRHTTMRTSILIDAAASIIENDVDLTAYRWQLLIEVLGNLMGLAAVNRDEVYSTKKTEETHGTDDWFLD